eukprot:5871106-Prymnesium_polylepis.1
MAAYTPAPWYRMQLWTNLFGHVIPIEIGGGVYQASFDVLRQQTLEYSFDVNELRGLNDACSAEDPLLNTSKIYVDCNVTRCTPARRSCTNAWCQPDEDLTSSVQSAAVRGSASIVRLFEWPYSAVGEECARLSEQGWTAVEISPPASHE